MTLTSNRLLHLSPPFRKGGRGTHFIRFFIAISSALLFFLVLHHWADRSREYEALLDKENAKLGVAKNLISFRLDEVISRMAVLAKDPSVQETLRHPWPANRQSLASDLSAYVAQEELLDEIILLDPQGREIVHASTSHAPLPQAEEMWKKLGKALSLTKNQVYLAPLILPGTSSDVPVLHLAVPVFQQNTKTGTLLAVYSSAHFKHLLDDVLGPTLGHIVILNGTGDTIYQRAASGRHSPLDPSHLPQTHPTVWKQILASPAEKFDSDQGWLLYTTIDLARHLFLHDSIDAVTDPSSDSPNNRHEWKILSLVPPSAVNPAWENHLKENLPLYFLMFGGTGLFAWQRAQRREESKQAEESLKASQEMLVTVLDSMEASVYVTDMHSYEMLFANRHLYRTLGKSNLIGKICWQELHPGQTGPCTFCDSAPLLDRTGATPGIREYQDPYSGRWVQLRDNAIHWVDGRVVRLEIATDITEQRESMALRCARKTAVEQNSRFNIAEEMASGLAHELSQPLAAAHNYLDACLRLAENEHHDAEKLRQGLRLAHMQTERAGKIISHIKGTIRKRGNERAAMDINRLIQETVGYLEYEIRQYDINIRFDLDPAPFVANINGVEIEQVLLNLMRNAIDSMGDAPLRHLGLSSRPGKDGSILVRISDTGKGISHADLDFIFNPFLTTKDDGLGLGLTICRTIIESYGGRIWAESSSGHGATFCFTLPGDHGNE